ncbi:methionine ABC transporter permease [Bifidobacterium gallicum]|uniref:ABC transporter, permease protein n=1 Tax=Bifidobacterium gallicum DSM 20093 = LMG 11596 TaxID=561180 RepID=D1NSS4_9BIFI|nr:methionine ABC transporter permease [Bifidobacterium gallicum]EFA23726.1 ABC transporter, permease protein [Bifidobacterium gallicum DSM 20093 = LMG 11596]KFI59255.1 methionine ABC transporter permease [Bifidobacterium gallicum DSM 20093 = LMG 11596]
MNWQSTLEILQDNLGKALADTFFMVSIATVVGVVFGTLLAIALFLTQHHLFSPNAAVNNVVGFIVNAIRSMPFLILLVVLIPLIQLIIGDPYTPLGGAIALSIAAIPFFARIAENSFTEVDSGLIEAAIATGAPTRQILCDAIFPQALPSFIRGIVLTIISLLGYSAMVGTIGAGGIGDMAIQFGYNRYETGVLIAIVVLLVVLVQAIQWIGDLIARAVTH